MSLTASHLNYEAKRVICPLLQPYTLHLPCWCLSFGHSGILTTPRQDKLIEPLRYHDRNKTPSQTSVQWTPSFSPQKITPSLLPFPKVSSSPIPSSIALYILLTAISKVQNNTLVFLSLAICSDYIVIHRYKKDSQSSCKCTVFMALSRPPHIRTSIVAEGINVWKLHPDRKQWDPCNIAAVPLAFQCWHGSLVSLFLYLSICQSVCLSIHLSIIFLWIHLFIFTRRNQSYPSEFEHSLFCDHTRYWT